MLASDSGADPRILRRRALTLGGRGEGSPTYGFAMKLKKKLGRGVEEGLDLPLRFMWSMAKHELAFLIQYLSKSFRWPRFKTFTIIYLLQSP